MLRMPQIYTLKASDSNVLHAGQTLLSPVGQFYDMYCCWTILTDPIAAKNVVYDKVVIENLSSNQNLPKNTDGWDSYNVDGLTVRDAWVNIGDDCFSPKPNTTNIYVKNIYCNGTHGMSMGSIGQYPGVKDYISNAWVEDVVMLNAEVSSLPSTLTTS